MLDVQFRATPVELMTTTLCALAQAKETIGELLAIVRENGADAYPLPDRVLRSNVSRGGQAGSKSRRKRRALAAILLL